MGESAMQSPRLVALVLALLCAGAAAAPAGEAGKPPVNFSSADRFYVRYSVKDLGGAGVSTVEIWASSDGGKTWKKFAEDPTLSGRAIVKVPADGTYDFVTVAVDKAGNRERLPDDKTSPAFRVVVDHTGPKVTARGPADGTLAQAGSNVEFTWKAEDPYLVDDSVELQMKLEPAQDWQTVATAIGIEGSKTIKMPQVREGRALFQIVARDRAGNVGAAAAGSVIFDTLPPEGHIVAPPVARALDVEVVYEVVDRGPAGLATVTVYFTADGGRTWDKLADASEKAASVRVHLPRSATYGLALAATDRAGNALPPPTAGKAPAFTLLTDVDAPRLKLLEPREGQAFSGSGTIAARWTAEDENFGEGPIAIELSCDGGDSWTAAGRGLANNGAFSWKAPAIDSTKCLVRLRAKDVLGNESLVTSRPFTVANSAPSSQAAFEPIPDDTGGSPSAAEEALLGQGEALLGRGMHAQAAETAGKVLAANPRSGAAYILRGRALLAASDPAAAADFEKAAEIVPDAIGLPDYLGQAHYIAGVDAAAKGARQQAAAEFTRSVGCFERALATGQDAWRKHYNLALSLVALARQQADPKDSRKLAGVELAKALELAGEDKAACADVTWYLAVLREDEGGFRDAARLWRKAADLRGKDTELGKRALDNAVRCEKKK